MHRLITSLAVMATACAISPRAPMSIVLITMDTTRADRLSPYGFNARMPALERLARDGIVFEQAATVAPLTLPAHTSLFTGLLPPRHGVRDNAAAPLEDHQITLAEILRQHGYRTAASVGSAVLDPDRGLRQGFEEYGTVPRDAVPPWPAPGRRAQRRADAVVDEAIQWLDTVGQASFFLWTHLYDPHRPYDAPEPFASRYEPYVAEIVYADSQIARLLDALDVRGLRDRVAVIVTGDHGESLGDHGEVDHGVFLYESVLRVPLIVRVPGERPGLVGGLVRVVDIMPTILHIVGILPPPVDGVSLVQLMRGRSRSDLEAYAESTSPQTHGWAPLFSLRNGRFKFIDAPQPELYDLLIDPLETRNLFQQRPALAAAMQARLKAERLRDVTTEQPTFLPNDEVRARLGALGYSSGRTPGAVSALTELPDPKSCPGVFEAGRCR